jgi:hypothetical protein
VHNADEFMAMGARRLAEHLERSDFLVMMRATDRRRGQPRWKCVEGDH